MQMIEVLNDYSRPAIPQGFERALKLIDPNLSLLWHEKAQRWLIVTYGIPREVFRDGYVVEYIVSKDNAYAPLSEDVLYFLSRSKWERDHNARKYDPRALDNHLQEVDDENDARANAAEKQRLDGFSQGAKKAHKFRTTETFI